jgi:hypothetical protein
MIRCSTDTKREVLFLSAGHNDSSDYYYYCECAIARSYKRLLYKGTPFVYVPSNYFADLVLMRPQSTESKFGGMSLGAAYDV